MADTTFSPEDLARFEAEFQAQQQAAYDTAFERGRAGESTAFPEGEEPFSPACQKAGNRGYARGLTANRAETWTSFSMFA